MRFSLGLMLLALASPTHARWSTTSDAVRAAAANPQVARALAAMDRIDAAIVAGDGAGFAGAFAADAVVNNPQNRVSPPGAPAQRFVAGAIAYSSYERHIDHVGLRPSGEVVAMGEEIVRPRAGAVDAGKTVRRRFTDIWRDDGGTWKLALRQATVIGVE